MTAHATGRALSPRQSQLLDFLRAYFEENDQLPPMPAAAQHFGIRVNAICELMQALVRKGWIEHNKAGRYRFTRVPGTSALSRLGWPRIADTSPRATAP
jgi:predicted transcriptional regulator